MRLTEKIKAIEEEMKKTQIHKHTEHHIGLLKAKLARLKAEQEEMQRSKRCGSGFELKKSGDCTVAIIGPPSVGKSTILNMLTGARSKVGSYAFTTVTVVPGVLEYESAKIQILDLPGVIHGASSGTGKGKRVLSVARNVDMILLVVDVFQPSQVEMLKRELYEAGIRLNARPPNVSIERTKQGGLGVTSTCKLTRLSMNTAKAILNIHGIHHGKVIIREDISDDELIDAVVGNRRYIPAVSVLNRIDLVDGDYLVAARRQTGEDFIGISACREINLDLLKDAIYNRLNLIRVYLKPRNCEADFNEPLILRAGSTVSDACAKIHRKLCNEAKYALVSGTSVKFSPQRVGMDHVIHDGDIVTIVT
ncbi:GTP-binding protein [Candidatus Bathyarchaeota archaeon]|nr:GTP-binding protein [Candidatus Bathyarchaeota archaeon]